MSLEHLSVAMTGERPVGEDCEIEIQTQNFALMTEYLVERVLQKARERAAEQRDLEESELRNAEVNREDGRRRLTSLEAILKDVLKVSSVNVDQVAAGLRDKASALLTNRGKDLRVMPHLCAALIYIDGIGGYAECLSLATSLLQAYPGDLHPLPDEDDPADAWQRVNAVSELIAGNAVCVLLSPLIMLGSRQSGRLTLADLAGGLIEAMPASDVAPADLAMLLADVGPEAVQSASSMMAAIQASIEMLVALCDPGKMTLPRLAEKLHLAVSRLRADKSSHASSAFADDHAHAAQPADKPNSGQAGSATRGAMQSREDARRVIQEVILYMERVEPSHPAPLLLKRADRLMGMSFFDIIKDMAPGAVSEIERIAGTEPSQ